MKILKQIKKNTNFWPIVVVILFGLLAAKGLIGPGYFNMHDDLQMMRQLEMEKCFLTLQIPCRWVPDMGYGFGFPLFNFYPPLPYLFGEIFRLFGTSFVETVKIAFIFAFVGSGVSMYFLTKEFWGKWGGVLSAIFYIWAPYHSVDIYVRGAMNEAWALIFFPLILFTGYKLITEAKRKWIILLALSWVGLLLSHNLMAMIFAPVFAVWVGIWLIKTREWRKIILLIISGALAFGLAAFFTLPVAIEQGLVQTQSLVVGYYDYSAHFASVGQLLFSRFWGYGPSVWEVKDGMSFQVGMVHWIVGLIVTTSLVAKNIIGRKKINWGIIASILFFFGVAWFAVLMVHNKSTSLWMNIEMFRFVQFPWRFLTLAILGFSFVAGAIVLLVPKRLTVWISSFLVICLLLFSWDYFVPQRAKLGPLTDEQKFSGAAWDLQQTAGIYDYLPNTAVTAPKAPMRNFVEVLSGEASSSNIKLGTHKNSFDISVNQEAEVRLGVFAFPNWKVFSDGEEVATFISESEQWGRIHVTLPVGEHQVRVELFNTPIRTIGNILSLVSWMGLGAYLMLQFKRNAG